jgi:hypothetical protein
MSFLGGVAYTFQEERATTNIVRVVRRWVEVLSLDHQLVPALRLSR